MTRRVRDRRNRPSPLVTLSWAAIAVIVAAGQLLDRTDATRRGIPPMSIPPMSVPPANVPPANVPPANVPPARVPPTPAPPRVRRDIPRPFAAIHDGFDSPLLTPRLRLPRVLAPKLAGLTTLLARARPGEPVAVTLTAYCLDGRTRRGNRVRSGIIAADPRIFPLAGHVELFSGGRYLGRFLVDDTGGHVRGTRIDIWTPDCADARRFGRRTGVATLTASRPR